MSSKTQKCRTCGQRKPADEFKGPYAKRCKACIRAVHNATCKACGGPAGVTAQEVPRARTYCSKPECISQAGRDSRAKRKPPPKRTTRRCPSCATVKPLTAEHWSPVKRGEDGSVEKWYSWCKPCTTAIHKERYHSDPEYRRRHAEYSARVHERTVERMREDEEFAERTRQLWRERTRRYKQRKRAGITLSPVVERVQAGGEKIPCAPLLGALDREAARSGRPVGMVCESIGVDERRVTAWRSGEYKLVALDLVDRALIGLDLLWWEVYPPDEFPQVAAIFEPEAVAA